MRPERALRVVLAEDSVLLREGITGLLTRFGHQVVALRLLPISWSARPSPTWLSTARPSMPPSRDTWKRASSWWRSGTKAWAARTQPRARAWPGWPTG
jgi:hypothetical protein